MKITSLELKNIRSYDEEKVNFPEGSVLLSGDIGHGKSTLLLAIEFALFGIKRGELTGDELLREGQKNGSVKLDFVIDGKDYTIMRSLKRTKNNVIQDSGYLITDGLREDLQPGELKARILEILGYPKELLSKQKSYIYRYTVYTPQEKMKEIILADEESRLETLRKIFGINKYKLIRDNVSVVRSELRGYQKKLSGIAEGVDEKKGELKNLKKEIFSIFEIEEKEIEKTFDEKVQKPEGKIFLEILKIYILRTIDFLWQEHLSTMEELRESVRLQAYGQIDPLLAYKKEGHRFFENLMSFLKEKVKEGILKIEIKPQILHLSKKPSRNDPCPCGSGKKYKKCCWPKFGY